MKLTQLGKEIVALINDKEEVFVIRGIFEDIPVNSTFQADCFINSTWAIENLNQRDKEWNAEKDWHLNFWETWLMLDKNKDIALFEFAIQSIGEKSTW